METNTTFLGKGWSFPPTFNRNTAMVEMVADAEDIQQSLQILLSTNLGERLMHPEFGCELSSYVFKEVTQGLLTGIKGIISDAILYYEPRIDLENIDISESGEEGLLLIDLEYTIRTTNSRFNLVYPFYINETQGLGLGNS